MLGVVVCSLFHQKVASLLLLILFNFYTCNTPFTPRRRLVCGKKFIAAAGKRGQGTINGKGVFIISKIPNKIARVDIATLLTIALHLPPL